MARQQMQTPRKPKFWAQIPGIPLDFTADATMIGGSLTFAEGPNTVMRMLGEFLYAPTTSPAAQDEALLFFAIGVASGDAIALGSTAIPDPGAEPEYSWLYWKSVPIFYNSTTIDGATAQLPGSGRVEFDVKTRRVIRPREGLFWVVQYSDIAGTPPITVGIGGTRVLLAHG